MEGLALLLLCTTEDNKNLLQYTAVRLAPQSCPLIDHLTTFAEVLLLGQYSVGKSTFIRHLLDRDYPGLRIGPEPTTDKFVVVTHGSKDQVSALLEFAPSQSPFEGHYLRPVNVLNFVNKKLRPRIEVIPGNAAAADPNLPFQGLNQFA